MSIFCRVPLRSLYKCSLKKLYLCKSRVVPIRLFSDISPVINGKVETKSNESNENSNSENEKPHRSKMSIGDYLSMGGTTLVVFALIGYFVKVSKEGKRHERVKDEYLNKCPINASESIELVSGNLVNLSFFNYFSQLLRREYPCEMTVPEFRSLMDSVLSGGGVKELEFGYQLDRLFDLLESNHCEIRSDGIPIDANTPYVDESMKVNYHDKNDLSSVKLPVKLLLTALLHIVEGDNDERIKALYRLFKENGSNKMERSEFTSVTYHLPVDYLSRKKKAFPLNEYYLATPDQLVDKALRLREEHSKVPVDAKISRKEFLAMITDQPLCIWGECYPVSQEEQKRIDEAKAEKEELEKLRKKESAKAKSNINANMKAKIDKEES